MSRHSHLPPCEQCGHAMRRRSEPAQEGIRVHVGNGICDTCRKRNIRAEETPFVPAISPPGEWVDEALCAQSDPEQWFPEKGESTRAAKAVCAMCPAIAACLETALENDEQHGVWGGLSPQERRELKRQKNAQGAA